MRSKFAVAVCVLALSGVALAADVIADYGLDRQAWADSILNSLISRGFYLPSVPVKLRNVAPANRPAVVRALGALARAYVDTAEFKAKYKTEYEASLPDDLKPPRSAKQIADQTRADLQKQIAELEALLKTLPSEMRQAAQDGITSLKEQSSQIDAFAAQQAADEKARYEEAKSRPPDPDATPSDPQLALKKTLKAFLDVTAAVDYAARTKAQAGLQIFVNADYESKPATWKLCYRAGREACDAARAFATGWLGDLK